MKPNLNFMDANAEVIFCLGITCFNLFLLWAILS